MQHQEGEEDGDGLSSGRRMTHGYFVLFEGLRAKHPGSAVGGCRHPAAQTHPPSTCFRSSPLSRPLLIYLAAWVSPPQPP